MNETLERRIELVREWLAGLEMDERVAVFNAVADGYCKHCGGNRLPCHCWNEE